MDYQELVVELAKKTNYTPREVRYLLREMVLMVREAIESGRDVSVEGLGRFLNLPQKQRVGRHPTTKERMIIPPTRRVRFEPCKSLKYAVRASVELFRIEDPVQKYGLATKENDNGETRSRDRSQEGREGETRRQRFKRRRPERQRTEGPGEGD